MGAFFSKQSLLTDSTWFDTPEKRYYDVVLVGGGPAGCVLANRLSEDGNLSVLLIEAGGDHENELYSKIPSAWARLLGSRCDWQYLTTPQPELNMRKLIWPRGKLLGGSSSINAMMYHHCAPSDYDEWESLGATGWSYKDMIPTFRRAENFTPHVLHADVDVSHRGQGGFWHTSYSHCQPITESFIKAAQSVGIPYNPDINTPKGTIGVATFSTFIDQTGSRSSGATAYLPKDVLRRQNLKVAVSTRVTKVILSSDNKKAIGVELVSEDRPGERIAVYAAKEVILCAGSINTPQLLMLSGIGPRKHLEELGIEVLHDLPAVGENLQDHLVCSLNFRAKKGTSLDYLRDNIKSLPALIWWLLGFKGPLTTNGGEAAAFIRTDDPRLGLLDPDAKLEHDPTSGPDAPDFEIIGSPVANIDHGRIPPPAGLEGFSMACYPLRPDSVGRLLLKSSDPFDKPIIEANYLTERSDIDVFIRGIRLALRIGRSSPLVENLDLKEDADPNDCSSVEDAVFNMGHANERTLTDETIEKWIRRNAETIYHPVGTARIGQDRSNSVVDPFLKVHGIEGLRIVDASVFPRIVSGHTCAPVISVAEMASDIIRASLTTDARSM